ncbi:hypothetical protein TNCV_906071 [Trichonephila clavipes]|nr:hypothetical protein TNCV_906071 [Trichonephila clavipes]
MGFCANLNPCVVYPIKFVPRILGNPVYYLLKRAAGGPTFAMNQVPQEILRCPWYSSLPSSLLFSPLAPNEDLATIVSYANLNPYDVSYLPLKYERLLLISFTYKIVATPLLSVIPNRNRYRWEKNINPQRATSTEKCKIDIFDYLSKNVPPNF